MKEFSWLLEAAIFLLFANEPSLWLFNLGQVNVDERLCFDKGSQDKSSQPEEKQKQNNISLWQY